MTNSDRAPLAPAPVVLAAAVTAGILVGTLVPWDAAPWNRLSATASVCQNTATLPECPR